MKTLYHYEERRRRGFLGYVFRFLFLLILLAGLGVVGYAYVGNLDVNPEPRVIELEIPQS